MHISEYLMAERLDLTLGTSGVIGTAATTVDITAHVGINASAPNLTFSLPLPSDPRPGRIGIVSNRGASAFKIVSGNVTLQPDNYYMFVFGDGLWRADVGGTTNEVVFGTALPAFVAGNELFWNTDKRIQH